MEFNRTKKYEASLQKKDEKGNTSLHLAAADGNLEKIRVLINLIIKRYPYLLETKNKFGSTPLHYVE
jgi:ankyrin repeat protein